MTLNMSVDDLLRKLDPQTKIVIVQHTFGNPGPLSEIDQICKERGIYLFEDCAHSLGGSYLGHPLGSIGDASLISFGLEKVLSTRVGGALVLNNKYLKNKVDNEYLRLKRFSYWATLLWGLNPIFWRFLRKARGKQNSFAKQLNKIGLLNLGFYDGEMYGKMPDQYPRKLSNSLAAIASFELKGLQLNLNHRSKITNTYYRATSSIPNISTVVPQHGIIPSIRFPIILRDKQTRDHVLNALRNDNIYAGDWYDPNIYPKGTSLESMKYVKGTCPQAEIIAERIINLPTGSNISEEEAERIVRRLNELINPL